MGDGSKMNSPKLLVKQLTKSYENSTKKVLESVNLAIAENEFICILGPSGCGKSTLLRCISGFESFEGEIFLNNRSIKEPDTSRIMVFQEFNQLFPWKTVSGNIQYALKVKRYIKDKKQLIEIADTYLSKVGLKDVGNYYPHQLSGGMKQRVAIARALAMKPNVILMDEPFASLDAMTRNHLQNELLSIFKEEKITVIFVTHNIEEALILSTRMIVLGEGGKIVLDEGNNLNKPVTPLVEGYSKLWEKLNNSL